MLKQSRLLIVDSDKASVVSMTKHFRTQGYEVHAVDTGEKAIDTVSKEKPDLVVLDINLPGMSGFELWGRLHAMAEFSDIPVLIVGQVRDRLAGHPSNEKYFVNPNDLFGLSRKLKALVQMCKRRRIIEELLAKEGLAIESEPMEELTAGEQEKLREAGANLQDVDLGPDDPVLLGKMGYLSLLESSFSTSQVAKMLRVNESRIRQRLTSRPPSLYGIKRGTEWLIPSFQFEGKKLIPNIDRVIAKLDDDLHPLSVLRWFTSPNADLIAEGSQEKGFSPREWLLRGLSIETVEELATDIHLS